MVYQELSLARPRKYCRKPFLPGRLPVNRFGFIDRKAMLNNAHRRLAQISLDINPQKTIEEISQHEAQTGRDRQGTGAEPLYSHSR